MNSLRRLPGPLTLTIGVVALEAGALLVLAGLELASFSSERVSLGVSTTLFFLLFAAFLATSAWGLVRLSSWARGPVVLAQLIALGLAWNFRTGEFSAVSVVLSVAAVAALVGVLARSSTAALEGVRPDEPDELDEPGTAGV